MAKFDNSFHIDLEYMFNNRIKDYQLWRKDNFKNNTGFFPIFSDFNKYINKLSPGAVKLYVFLGLHSNYTKGTSYYSIKRLSIEFGKSTRTISNWIQELEKNSLIYRKQKRLNGVSTTYLIPYR